MNGRKGQCFVTFCSPDTSFLLGWMALPPFTGRPESFNPSGCPRLPSRRMETYGGDGNAPMWPALGSEQDLLPGPELPSCSKTNWYARSRVALRLWPVGLYQMDQLVPGGSVHFIVSIFLESDFLCNPHGTGDIKPVLFSIELVGRLGPGIQSGFFPTGPFPAIWQSLSQGSFSFFTFLEPI